MAAGSNSANRKRTMAWSSQLQMLKMVATNSGSDSARYVRSSSLHSRQTNAACVNLEGATLNTGYIAGREAWPLRLRVQTREQNDSC